jgi:arsenate reductase (thioredoxin)
MAGGFLKSFNSTLEVHSAGTKPDSTVHTKAIQVMKEVGIDISKDYPKKIDEYLNDSFDYVITVCDNAKETYPVFFGKFGKQLNLVFENPAEAKGTGEEILNEFCRVRDKIKEAFYKLYTESLIKE